MTEVNKSSFMVTFLNVHIFCPALLVGTISQIIRAKFDQLLYENSSKTGEDKYENTILLVAAL